MKSLILILFLSTSLHAQTKDTLVEWRYDTTGIYGASNGSTHWENGVQVTEMGWQPIVDTSLYIGKDVSNPDSVYKAQLSIQAKLRHRRLEEERLAKIREAERKKKEEEEWRRIERRGYEIDSIGNRIYHHLPK